MKHLLLGSAALALIACGSKPSPATTPPPGPGDTAGSDTAGSTAPPDAAVTVAEPTVDAAPPPPDPAAIKAALLATEQDTFAAAKPVFTKFCASCHVQGGAKATKKKLGHFDMTAYPLGGHHAATIGHEILEVLGQTGEKATMPDNKPGSVTGADLAALTIWAQAWIAADDGGAHGPKAAGDHLDDDND